MKISELMEKLKELENRHGDLQVILFDHIIEDKKSFVYKEIKQVSDYHWLESGKSRVVLS